MFTNKILFIPNYGGPMLPMII